MPDHVLLREFIQRIMDERDHRYEDRFKAQEAAAAAALAAQKELTSAAFAASERAITKAEDAQKEYNARSNEFRGQLDDQAKRLMPRLECETRFSVIDGKIEDLKKDVASLRESRGEVGGRHETADRGDVQSNWRHMLLMAVAATASAIITVILIALLKR